MTDAEYRLLLALVRDADLRDPDRYWGLLDTVELDKPPADDEPFYRRADRRLLGEIRTIR